MRAGYRGAVGGLFAIIVATLPATIVEGQVPNVLLVGPAGTAGAQYTSIQAAVNAASPGDWILVAPGVYHEKGQDGPTDSQTAGVFITKPDIHLRGMDRNGVIVDGTNLSPSQPAGTAPAGSPACPTADAAQDLGPTIGGHHVGRNGVEAYKTTGVHVENMTVCNFLSANGSHTGNEVWWNAGDGSGMSMPMAAFGGYLTGTSTYFKDSGSAQAMYGIFTSNIAADPARGTSLIDYTYANNMSDSAYYIGACPDCNIILRHAHAQNAALGYSGTNGSGRLIIENGEWDHLHAGIAPNTLNNDDAPSPQTGICPAGVTSTQAGAPTDHCFIVRNNYVHDNNNPDNPGSGIASAAPVGIGILMSGTQYDVVINNLVTNNGSWGVIPLDYPDTETSPTAGTPADCAGGTGMSGACLYSSGNNYILNNVFSSNGANGNTTNGDIANEQLLTDLVSPGKNCFAGNTSLDVGGLKEFPPTGPTGLQETSCTVGNFDTGLAASQLICASGIITAVTGLPITCSQLAPANTFTYPTRNVNDANCAKVAPGSVATPANGEDPACIMTLAATMAQAALQPKMDPCVGPPPSAYCPAAATLNSETSLPNTAAGPSLAPLGVIVVGVVALSLAIRRRRRAA
ncbi:MAG TPA: hypothetical protein VG329_03640 [Candidatus Dormibacteraeota bacterium]|nr:hypothetical protein [Candidatus Dormibacteraeota bacterium]